MTPSQSHPLRELCPASEGKAADTRPLPRCALGYSDHGALDHKPRLRRDEVRGKQPSARVQSIRPAEPTGAQQDAPAQQSRLQRDGAASRRDDLPHSRAARAGALLRAIAIDAARTGAREHEFGEGRAPAGGAAAEDARVGATPDVFYVYAEGQRVAQVVQSHDGTFCLDSNTGKGTSHPFPKVAVETMSALHSDLQGTLTGATAIGASAVTSRQAFSPWGERLPVSAGGQSTPIDKVTVGFTDQEHDDTVGLVNMRGRVYDSITRTFLTPDPIVGSPFKVSGWNKYAYVLNNPLKYTDPSGFDGVDTDFTYADGNREVVFNDDLLQSEAQSFAPDQSVAPSTPVAPESFDPGLSSDSGFFPASLSENGGGGAGPDLAPIHAWIDVLNKDPYRGFTSHPHADIPLTIPTPGSQISAANDGVQGTGPSGPRYVDAPFYVGTIKSTQPLLGMVGPPLGGGTALGAAADGAFSPIVEGGGLAAHEAAGGHLLALHVGLDAAALDARGIDAASTFLTRAEAEATASGALSQNGAQISGWLQRGAATNLKITTRFSGGLIRVTGGYEASASSATFILKSNGSGGFFILTGFPAP